MKTLLTALLITLTLSPAVAMAQAPGEVTLKGGLRMETEDTLPANSPRVLDTLTQQPIAGARITIPDLGFETRSNTQGRYQIPPLKTIKPMIMTVEKPGYAPLTATLRHEGGPPFQLYLEKSSRIQVIDSRLHHLGDGQYADVSAAAGQFSKAAEGPRLTLVFRPEQLGAAANVDLEIGSIVGIDTEMSHFIEGSAMPNAASPMVVKLNEHNLGTIYVNGDQVRLTVPRGFFRPGQNTLTFTAGSQSTGPGRVDYDDMELMLVTLRYR